MESEAPVMSVTLNDLNAMAQSQLDTLFKSSAAGPIPDGDAKGVAIMHPMGTSTLPRSPTPPTVHATDRDVFFSE